MGEEAADSWLIEAGGRLLTHLPETNEITLLILKGHLLIEERLVAILKDSVRNPSVIEEVNLTFHKRLQVVKAMKCCDQNRWVWEAITKLNSLRNTLAHNLDSPQVDTKLQAFLASIESHPIFEGAKVDNITSRLNSALAFLYGALLADYVRK